MSAETQHRHGQDGGPPSFPKIRSCFSSSHFQLVGVHLEIVHRSHAVTVFRKKTECQTNWCDNNYAIRSRLQQHAHWPDGLTLQDGAKLTCEFSTTGGLLKSLHGQLPAKEWEQHSFEKARSVSGDWVYWLDDGPRLVPESRRVLYRHGGEWKPVEAAGAYGVEKDRFNEVKFKPVETDSLRREVKVQGSLRADFSAGILEWRVNP